MKLSQYTDNALKVLLYCASHKDRRVTRKEISEYFKLSEEHMRKVIHQLSQWQYINTYSGRYGGFELARPAAEINIGDVISKTENQITMFDCAGQTCRLLPSCSLNRVLMQAQKQFYNSLSCHTLDELVGDKATFNLLIENE